MGVGGSIFALAALLGLQLILTAVPSVYRALQIAGASYLLFIAFKLWVSAPKPFNGTESEVTGESSAARDFLLGLGTQLSNPKTAIVYASVFSAALPQEFFGAQLPLWCQPFSRLSLAGTRWLR